METSFCSLTSAIGVNSKVISGTPIEIDVQGGDVMGYESKVAIGCSRKVVKKYKNIFEEQNIYPDEIYANDNCAAFFWNWTKWYDDFDDVKAVMNLTEELMEDDENCISYLRIGEEFGDYEELGTPGIIYPFIDIKVNWQLSEVKSLDKLINERE